MTDHRYPVIPEDTPWDEQLFAGYRLTFSCGAETIIPVPVADLPEIAKRLDRCVCPGCGHQVITISNVNRLRPVVVDQAS